MAHSPQAGDGFVLPTLPLETRERNYNRTGWKTFSWQNEIPTHKILNCVVFMPLLQAAEGLFHFSPVNSHDASFFFLLVLRLTWRHRAAPVRDKGETMVGADSTRARLWRYHHSFSLSLPPQASFLLILLPKTKSSSRGTSPGSLLLGNWRGLWVRGIIHWIPTTAAPFILFKLKGKYCMFLHATVNRKSISVGVYTLILLA